MAYNVLYLHETAMFSGAENSLFNLILNLNIEKFNAVVACPPKGPFVDRLEALGVSIYPLEFPGVRKIVGLHATVNKLRDIIRKEKIALIHSNSIRTHIYAWLAGHALKIPIIWHQRNLIEKEIIDPDRMMSFLPDAIICNSAAIAKRFIAREGLPEKVHIIYNGVDTALFSPLIKGDEMRRKFGIGREEIVIGIASRFSKNKGHETFLSAAVKLLKEAAPGREKLRFLIAGGAVFAEDLEREQALRGLTKSLGIEDRVIFTGFVSQMQYIYAMMDIFVLASEAEPCGRVIFEAMASGKPMVLTNTGGTPEIAAEGVTAILVDPGDPDAMARAIKALLDDKEKAEAMGRLARRRAEELFGIEKNVRMTEALYGQLLKS